MIVAGGHDFTHVDDVRCAVGDITNANARPIAASHSRNQCGIRGITIIRIHELGKRLVRIARSADRHISLRAERAIVTGLTPAVQRVLRTAIRRTDGRRNDDRTHPLSGDRVATLTCSPWRWVLVAPSKLAPEGFVNVQTGETHKVVWA